MPARVGKALSQLLAGRRDATLTILPKTENEMERVSGRFRIQIQDEAGLRRARNRRPCTCCSIRLRAVSSAVHASCPIPFAIDSFRPEFQRLTGEARQCHQQFHAKFFQVFHGPRGKRPQPVVRVIEGDIGDIAIQSDHASLMLLFTRRGPSFW